MDIISKKDLLFNDYFWSLYSIDDPRVSGELDNTMFNRKEGYEVLYFINQLASKHNIKDIESCQKFEIMIRKFIPSFLQSQRKVQLWIESHWYNY